MNKFLFDVGHHYGEGLNYLSKLYSVDESWSVFAFEPNEHCYRDMVGKHPPNVVLLPFAAWIRPTVMHFNRTSYQEGGKGDGDGSHLQGIGVTRMNQHAIDSAQVKCVDFSKFLDSIVPFSDSFCVLKLDCEGSEYEILNSMIVDDSLRRVNKLHIEFHHSAMSPDQVSVTKSLKKTIKSLYPNTELIDHW